VCGLHSCSWLATGHNGHICDCATHLLKVAKHGHECALGDELRSLLMTQSLPCFAKLHLKDSCMLPGVPMLRSQIASPHVAPIKSFCLEKAPGLTGYDAWHAGDGRPPRTAGQATAAACRKIHQVFEAGGRVLAYHDNPDGKNFLFDAAALKDAAFTGPSSQRCPIHIIDMPQHKWPKRGVPNAGPLRGMQPLPADSTATVILRAVNPYRSWQSNHHCALEQAGCLRNFTPVCRGPTARPQ